MTSKGKQSRPYLAITMGDPAGIGPEIIVKALASPRVWRACRPIVVGATSVFEQEVRRLQSLPVSYTHLTLPTNREV